MNGRMLLYGLLSTIVLLSVFVIPLSAWEVQMAESLGVEDATGNSGDYVDVPVIITNTTNGSIENIVFYISYDKTVINLTVARMETGVLTSNWWIMPTIGEEDFIRLMGIYGGTPIVNGSTGSVAVLNFSVIGASGTTSIMNLHGIKLKNENGDDGFTPAKNGTFTILSRPTFTPLPSPTEPPVRGGGGGGGAIPPTDVVVSTPTPSSSPTRSVALTSTPVSTPTPFPTPSPSPTLTPTPSSSFDVMIFFVIAGVIAGVLAVALLVLRIRKA